LATAPPLPEKPFCWSSNCSISRLRLPRSGCTGTCVCVCVCVCVCTSCRYVCIHTCMHACIHTCMHAYNIHTYIHACMHMNTFLRTRTCTHTNTHTHTHTHRSVLHHARDVARQWGGGSRVHEGGDTERAGFYSPTLECVEETCATMAAALRARGNEKMKVCV